MAKERLGRGLSAILGEVEEVYRKEGADISTVQEIDIELIDPNPFQPRKVFDEGALKELANSIKQYGILQPIILIPNHERYFLIAGERRLRASKLAGLEQIKAVISDLEYDNLRELGLIENIQRENLNPIELAKSLKELIGHHGVTHDDVSKIIHKSRTYVTNALRLLNLLEYTQAKIIEGKLTTGHAKVLLGLEADLERKAVDSIINQKLNVREAEQLVRHLKMNNETDLQSLEPKKEIISFDVKPLQSLASECGFKAKTRNNTLIISFETQEEIEQLSALLRSRH